MHVWLGVCVCVCLCVYLCKHNHMWTDECVHVYQTGLGTCQALVRSSTNSWHQLNSYYLSMLRECGTWCGDCEHDSSA